MELAAATGRQIAIRRESLDQLVRQSTPAGRRPSLTRTIVQMFRWTLERRRSTCSPPFAAQTTETFQRPSPFVFEGGRGEEVTQAGIVGEKELGFSEASGAQQICRGLGGRAPELQEDEERDVDGQLKRGGRRG